MSDTRITPDDQLDWDRDRHGRMRDYATADDAVATLTIEEDLARPRLMAAAPNPRQTRLASHLRDRGLPVEVVSGWETRGSATFAPRGVVDHWTAGPKTGDRPSLRICVEGRTGLAGPLCNVFLTRAGVCVVVAAGRANHAGAGSFRGLIGNSSVFGIEAEEDGDGNWTDAQRAVYPLLNAALLELARADWSMVCGHNEWATPPGRKVDIRTWTMPAMRAQTAAAWRLDRPTITALQERVGVPIDGTWGPQTVRATQAWLDRPATGVWTDDDARAIQRLTGATVDGVLGPASIRSIHQYLTAPKPAPVPEEDIMASIEDLRTVVREELAAIFAGKIPVSAGTDRAWTTTRDAALAEAAELGKVRLPDDTIRRTDDVLGELAEFLAEVREAGEDEIRKAMGV